MTFLAMMLLPVGIACADQPAPTGVTMKTAVAVADFTAQNASATDASVLTGFIRVALSEAGDVTVVDKRNMDKLLQEQAFQQTGCTSEECAVKLGKILNVQKMVVGSYSLLGETRFLTASLVDVETGRIERSAKQKGFTLDNADEACAELVRKLFGAVPDRPASAYAPPVQRAPTPEEEREALARAARQREELEAAMRRDEAERLAAIADRQARSFGWLAVFGGTDASHLYDTDSDAYTSWNRTPVKMNPTAPGITARLGVTRPMGSQANAGNAGFELDVAFRSHEVAEQDITYSTSWSGTLGLIEPVPTGQFRAPRGYLEKTTVEVTLGVHVQSPVTFAQFYLGPLLGFKNNRYTSKHIRTTDGKPFASTQFGVTWGGSAGVRRRVGRAIGFLEYRFLSELNSRPWSTEKVHPSDPAYEAQGQLFMRSHVVQAGLGITWGGRPAAVSATR